MEKPTGSTSGRNKSKFTDSHREMRIKPTIRFVDLHLGKATNIRTKSDKANDGMPILRLSCGRRG